MQEVTIPEEENEHKTINGAENNIYVAESAGAVTALLFPFSSNEVL